MEYMFTVYGIAPKGHKGKVTFEQRAACLTQYFEDKGAKPTGEISKIKDKYRNRA